jgi:hypothetical protein
MPLSMELGSLPSSMLLFVTRSRSGPSSFQNFLYSSYVSPFSPGDFSELEFWSAVVSSSNVIGASHFFTFFWVRYGYVGDDIVPYVRYASFRAVVILEMLS